jgi:AcrR family transcriptional regulator
VSVEVGRVGRDLTADERRTHVLRAALGCIAEVGHESLRLRDVAKAAGVSIGLLQHYFETRDQLVAQAFRQASEDLLEQWSQALVGDLDPWDRIVALVSHLTGRDNLRARCLIWVDFGAASARHEETRREFVAVCDQWESRIQDAIADGTAAGDFHPILPAAEIVEILLEQLDGGIFAIASGRDPIDGTRLREITLRVAAVLLGHGAASA